MVRAYVDPSATILLPAVFFLHAIAARHAPNGFIYLAYVGAMVLASGLLTLGVGR